MGEVSTITETTEEKTALLTELAPPLVVNPSDEPTPWTNTKKGLAILAKNTFNRMRYRTMRGEKRGKPTPQWNLPRELWRILFMPSKFIKNERGALRPETR